MRIGKDLVAASATPVVLSILAEGPCHGYAIQKRVEALSSHQWEWNDGLLYPLLHRLERLGLITADWSTSPQGRRRKTYTLTDRGRDALADQQAQWRVVAETLNSAWQALPTLTSPPRPQEA